ncbi:hypothetical protein INR49_003555 [Caranx melampygus]|nr:hypothetical protein INR49_003555 [Caranx melampygus]
MVLKSVKSRFIEEAELRSDGTKSTIKPSQMSVARITCVRGQGPTRACPSSMTTSPHRRESTYLKLRFLIDTGVRFVGHGLQKDFRVINLLVLKDQVVDTVYLFHLPRKRMISLRFLAWYFLDLNIQGETHDSIEDARTALQLYRKYLELSRGGGNDEVRKILKGLYEKVASGLESTRHRHRRWSRQPKKYDLPLRRT